MQGNRISSETMDEVWAELGLGQNREKAAHVPMFMGVGCVQETKKAMEQGKAGDDGTVSSCERYLGNMMDAEGRTSTNVKKRIRAMQEGWYGKDCLLYTSPSPRDLSTSRMPSSA